MQSLLKLMAALSVLIGSTAFGACFVGRTLPEAPVAVVADDRTGSSEIYLSDVKLQVRKRLTYNDVPDELPVLSPDRSLVAFVSYRTGNQEVFVMDADGANVHNLSRNPAADFAPVWSPDGRQIAFSSWHDEVFEIFVIHSDGSALRSVSYGLGDAGSPLWSPDGDFIRFETRRKGGVFCYRVDMNAVSLNALPVSCEA